MEENHQGPDWSLVFEFNTVQQDGNHLLITSEDQIAGFKLVHELKLNQQSDVLQVRNTLTNLKSATYQVDRLAVTKTSIYLRNRFISSVMKVSLSVNLFIRMKPRLFQKYLKRNMR